MLPGRGRNAVVWLCDPARCSHANANACLCTLPAAGKVRSWQHRGNSRSSRCVRCVRESPQIGRSGRPRTYLGGMCEVEGLVGRFPRGGSSPLGRIRFGLQICRSESSRSSRGGGGGRPRQRFGNTDADLAISSCIAVMTAGRDQRPTSTLALGAIGLRAPLLPPSRSTRISGVPRATEPLRIRSLLVVAVAQTPGGLTEAFLRAGSKKPRVVTCRQRALFGLGAAGPVSDRHSDRGPGLR
jgi:hypothetical protein